MCSVSFRNPISHQSGMPTLSVRAVLLPFFFVSIFCKHILVMHHTERMDAFMHTHMDIYECDSERSPPTALVRDHFRQSYKIISVFVHPIIRYIFFSLSTLVSLCVSFFQHQVFHSPQSLVHCWPCLPCFCFILSFPDNLFTHFLTLYV